MLRFIISPEEGDQTIISFIKRKFKSTPSSLIYKLFRTKKIQINQQNCRYYQYRLQAGDKVSIDDDHLQISTSENRLPVEPTIEIKVVYEDQNILVVIKEHNVEIHNKKNKDCLDNIVQHYLYQQNPQLYQKWKEKFFVPVATHRLDKLTKGLVIYPKNPITKKILYNSINDKKKISKDYLAICEDQQSLQLPPLIKGYIYKNEERQRMEFSSKTAANSKYCSLEAQIARKKGSFKLVKITLNTGRKHQIRTILSAFQMPIVGDKKYGSKINLANKIHLFAYQLNFNNLPRPLDYLNGMVFRLDKLEKNVIDDFLTFARKKNR